METATGSSWRRSEAGFLVIAAALGGGALSALPLRLLPPPVAPADLPAWGIAWALLVGGLGATALYGVYRALRTGSIRQPALLAFAVASVLVVGVEDWLVSLVPVPLSVTFRSSAVAAALGVNLGGLLLLGWFLRLRHTSATARNAPPGTDCGGGAWRTRDGLAPGG